MNAIPELSAYQKIAKLLPELDSVELEALYETAFSLKNKLVTNKKEQLKRLMDSNMYK